MCEMKHYYKKFTIEKQGRIINGLLKVNKKNTHNNVFIQHFTVLIHSRINNTAE